MSKIAPKVKGIIFSINPPFLVYYLKYSITILMGDYINVKIRSVVKFGYKCLQIKKAIFQGNAILDIKKIKEAPASTRASL